MIEKLIQAIHQLGVRYVMIAPGARLVPLLEPIQQIGWKSYWWVDERSAAFFALGLSRREKAPVVVVTTSGTAAGELLPAAMEAFYSTVPLILLTTDRPSRFRGSGAPQAAEQVRLFGHYTPCFFDLETSIDALSFDEWDQLSPLHINLCLEEP